MLVGPMTAAGQALCSGFGSRVARDNLACVKDLNGMSGEAHIDPFADQPVRHRVICSGDLNVIIGVHLGLAPLAELVRSGRQELERRSLELLESSAARALDLFASARPPVRRSARVRTVARIVSRAEV
jgi:hypothetical protein